MLGLLGAGLCWPIGPLRRIRRFFDEELRPLLAARPWSDLALLAVAAGVGEEMLFRGTIQGALDRAWGPTAGVLGASVIFGLLHPITPGYTVIAGLLGAYLGVVWLITGNLLAVMVAHALYDFAALLILLRSERTPGAD
jgi:membrane protease YdiL (CAAX protease family)